MEKKILQEAIKEEINKLFLFEERGVPDDVIKALEDVQEKIKNLYLSIKDYEWSNAEKSNGQKISGVKKFEDDTEVKSDDLFFKKINIFVNFIKVFDKNISDEMISKSNRGSINKATIIFDEQSKKIRLANITTNICFRAENLNPDLTFVAFHEFLHLYELYQKNLNGVKLYSSKSHVYNALRDIKTSNPTIEKVIHLIYCTLDFENNAFIGGLYGELRHSTALSEENIKKEFYETNFYKEVFSKLERPEIYITKEEVDKLSNDEFKEFNSIIESESKKSGFESLKRFKLYYKDNKEVYFNRLFRICKNKCEYLRKKVKRVIEKVYKDKNPTLIKEWYGNDTLDGDKFICGEYLK